MTTGSSAATTTTGIVPSTGHFAAIAIFGFGFKGYLDMTTPPSNAYEILVDAQKWNWSFTYPNGYVDADLHVPVDRPIRLVLSSQDVIHSLYIPSFRIKMDVVPGRYSKAWFEANEARLDESTSVPFLGTGPYVLGEADFGRSLTYVRNSNWWGADLPINKGRFNFDSVRIEYFADASAALEGFKAGEYTLRIENSSKEWATSYEFPALSNGYVKVETLPDGNIGSAQGFVFNLRRDKWQDPRTRDAVRMLFNFEWSNETLFYGLYGRTDSFWEGTPMEAIFQSVLALRAAVMVVKVPRSNWISPCRLTP